MSPMALHSSDAAAGEKFPPLKRPAAASSKVALFKKYYYVFMKNVYSKTTGRRRQPQAGTFVNDSLFTITGHVPSLLTTL